MVFFKKENGYPVDLKLHTEDIISEKLYKTTVYVNDEQVDDFITTNLSSRNMYVRGYFRALGYKFVSEDKKEEPFSEIKCNYIDCAAGMGVAGNRNCFLKGDYTNPECPKFYDEEKFLKDTGAE